MRRINTPDGNWQPGDPSTGIKGTIVTRDYMQSQQEELAAVPESVGIALDPNDNKQLLKGIRKIYADGIASGIQTAGKINGVNNPNLLLNGSGEFGNSGWSLAAGISSASDASGGFGTFFSNSAPLASVTGYNVGPRISASPNTTFSTSIDISTIGVTAGTVLFYLQAFDSSGNSTGGGVGSVQVQNGVGNTRYVISGITPSNTVSIAPVVALLSGFSAAAYGITFRRCKVEAGGSASLYSQEASIANVNSGRLLRTSIYRILSGVQQVSVNGGAFTATGAGTFTALAQTSAIRAVLVGGGGGSAGVPSTGTGQVAAAGGGAGGVYGEGRFTSGIAGGLAVTVGIGGSGGAAGLNNGGAGGTSSLGSLISVGGGNGSIATAAQPAPILVGAGTSTTIATGVNLYGNQGGPGGLGQMLSSSAGVGGGGGANGAGWPGPVGATVGSPGIAGTASIGVGASGGSQGQNGSALAGAPGGPGMVAVFEYA